MPGIGCSVCKHPKINEINTALAQRKCNQRDLAASFGLSQFAVCRHKRGCIKRAVSKALIRQELLTGSSMITAAQGVQDIVQASLTDCANTRNHSVIAPLAGAYIKTAEHIAKLAGLDGYKQVQAAPIAIDARGSRFLIMPVPAQAAEQLALTDE